MITNSQLIGTISYIENKHCRKRAGITFLNFFKECYSSNNLSKSIYMIELLHKFYLISMKTIKES